MLTSIDVGSNSTGDAFDSLLDLTCTTAFTRTAETRLRLTKSGKKGLLC
jgi:hypothetical protein